MDYQRSPSPGRVFNALNSRHWGTCTQGHVRWLKIFRRADDVWESEVQSEHRDTWTALLYTSTVEGAHLLLNTQRLVVQPNSSIKQHQTD